MAITVYFVKKWETKQVQIFKNVTKNNFIKILSQSCDKKIFNIKIATTLFSRLTK
jgi:hypothetical protein